MPAAAKPNLSDEKVLRIKFRELDLTEPASSSKEKSLDDLAAMISEVKRKAREEKEASRKKKWVPPGGFKEADPELAPPPGKPDPVDKAKKMTTIDKYRTLVTPKVWDAAMRPSASLEKTLYRKSGGDTSGHRIFNLGRDAYPKDIPAQWKPGQCDNDFGTPSLELVTDSFRGMLTRHVTSAAPKIEAELKFIPESSTNERNAKSRIRGELAILRKGEAEVMNEFARIDKLQEDLKTTKQWSFTKKGLV